MSKKLQTLTLIYLQICTEPLQRPCLVLPADLFRCLKIVEIDKHRKSTYLSQSLSLSLSLNLRPSLSLIPILSPNPSLSLNLSLSLRINTGSLHM